MSELDMYFCDEMCIKNVEWKYWGKKLYRGLKTQQQVILKLQKRTGYNLKGQANRYLQNLIRSAESYQQEVYQFMKKERVS